MGNQLICVNNNVIIFFYNLLNLNMIHINRERRKNNSQLVQLFLVYSFSLLLVQLSLNFLERSKLIKKKKDLVRDKLNNHKNQKILMYKPSNLMY